MRCQLAIVLGLTFGACSGDDPVAESVLESEARQTETCSVTTAAQVFRRASQVDYDYRPHTPAELFARSGIVARGRISALRAGVVELRTPSHDIELTLDAVYKGAITPGDRVRFQIAYAPVVSEAEQKALLALPAEVSVVAFLSDGSADALAPSAGSVLRLSSPQGLLVAADCGVAPTLDSLPLFDAEVQSVADVDQTLRSLAGM